MAYCIIPFNTVQLYLPTSLQHDRFCNNEYHETTAVEKWTKELIRVPFVINHAEQERYTVADAHRGFTKSYQQDFNAYSTSPEYVLCPHQFDFIKTLKRYAIVFINFLYCSSLSTIHYAVSNGHQASPILNSPVSYLNLSFPQEVENPSLSRFLSSLVCIYLGDLRTDISGIDQASSFHLTHVSLSFTVISFTPIFMLFDL